MCEEEKLVKDMMRGSNLDAKQKNLLMGSNPIIAPDSEMLWNAAIVWRILRRYEYTGALVMGRRKKIDVNSSMLSRLAAMAGREVGSLISMVLRDFLSIQFRSAFV